MDECSMQRERIHRAWTAVPRSAARPRPCPQGRDTSIESRNFRSGGCGGTSTSRAEIRGEEQKRVLFESIGSDSAPALRKVNGVIPDACGAVDALASNREAGGCFAANVETSLRGGACRAAFRDPGSASGLGKPGRAIA